MERIRRHQNQAGQIYLSQTILLLGAVFLWGSCETPALDDAALFAEISEPKLVVVLADMHIAEAAMQGVSSEMRDSVIFDYYDQIYEIHQTDRLTFKKSMEQLSRYPERLEVVYDSVRVVLEQQKTDLEKERDAKMKELKG